MTRVVSRTSRAYRDGDVRSAYVRVVTFNTTNARLYRTNDEPLASRLRSSPRGFAEKFHPYLSRRRPRPADPRSGGPGKKMARAESAVLSSIRVGARFVAMALPDAETCIPPPPRPGCDCCASPAATARASTPRAPRSRGSGGRRHLRRVSDLPSEEMPRLALVI